MATTRNRTAAADDRPGRLVPRAPDGWSSRTFSARQRSSTSPPISTRSRRRLRHSSASQPDSRLLISESGAITFAPHLVARSDAARHLSRSQPITDLCHDLLGPDVRLYWDQLVYKHPDKPREFPWHQDNGYAYVEPQQYLTVWLALTDATIDNGCPWVAEAEHTHGTLEHRYVHPLGMSCFDDRPDAIPATVASGGAVVFSSLTPHRTGPNTTGSTRKTYILQYAPDGAEVLHGDPAAGPPSDRVAPGRPRAAVRGPAQRRNSRSRGVKPPDWADRVTWLTWPVVLVVIQQIWFPAPTGALVAGFILGLITSLVSLGMYLVYRANRVLNFTAGELGLLPAVLSVMLIIESGLSWYLGLGIGFAAAAALGVAVEFLIIRRFFDAPRLVVTVATIGVAQLLGVAALFLPGWWGARVQSQRIDAPFSIDFEIGSRVFNANHVVALVLAPAAMVAVALLLRSTRIGIAIRAAAELPSRAAMLGIPVKGLQSVVWSVATILGFLALFLRSGIYGLPVGGALGLLLLLRSLAALTLGRLIHLPTIIAASLALGILQEAVVWNSGSIEAEAKMGAITGVVIVAGLLFRRTRGMRSEVDPSSWQNAGDVRPIANVYRALPLVRIGRIVGSAAIAIAFLAFPSVFGTTVVVRMALIFLFAITLMSFGVLTGWAGQLSLGQLAFSSIGAATSAWLTQRWNWDITLTTLVAGTVGALVSLVVGVPALRLRGAYLAVTTLAFAITVSGYFLNPRFFDWLPTGRIERNPIFGVIDWSSSTRHLLRLAHRDDPRVRRGSRHPQQPDRSGARSRCATTRPPSSRTA